MTFIEQNPIPGIEKSSGKYKGYFTKGTSPFWIIWLQP